MAKALEVALSDLKVGDTLRVYTKNSLYHCLVTGIENRVTITCTKRQTSPNLRVGDIVRLKSGSPELRVTRLTLDSEGLRVTVRELNQRREKSYLQNSLTLIRRSGVTSAPKVYKAVLLGSLTASEDVTKDILRPGARMYFIFEDRWVATKTSVISHIVVNNSPLVLAHFGRHLTLVK